MNGFGFLEPPLAGQGFCFSQLRVYLGLSQTFGRLTAHFVVQRLARVRGCARSLRRFELVKPFGNGTRVLVNIGGGGCSQQRVYMQGEVFVFFLVAPFAEVLPL